MNMISQLRARIQEAGLTILTADEYNQLQREWITRTGAEDMAAAERERMTRLYEVVSRIVEQGNAVNITRLHDYCGGEQGLSADAVDGGPIDE